MFHGSSETRWLPTQFKTGKASWWVNGGLSPCLFWILLVFCLEDPPAWCTSAVPTADTESWVILTAGFFCPAYCIYCYKFLFKNLFDCLTVSIVWSIFFLNLFKCDTLFLNLFKLYIQLTKPHIKLTPHWTQSILEFCILAINWCLIHWQSFLN